MAGLLSATLLVCVRSGVRPGWGLEPLGALRHGPLVVWYWRHRRGRRRSNLDAIAALHNATPLNYSEKTTGNFGQNASTYGQNAASYGVDADSRSISTPSIPPDQNATSAKPNGIGYRAEGCEQLRAECRGATASTAEQRWAGGEHGWPERWELWHRGKPLWNGGQQCGAECVGLWSWKWQWGAGRGGKYRCAHAAAAVEKCRGRASEAELCGRHFRICRCGSSRSIRTS